MENTYKADNVSTQRRSGTFLKIRSVKTFLILETFLFSQPSVFVWNKSKVYIYA